MKYLALDYHCEIVLTTSCFQTWSSSEKWFLYRRHRTLEARFVTVLSAFQPLNSNHSSKLAVDVNDYKAKEASHVYVRVDNPKSLMPKYCGPFEVISRPSDSTVQVKTGNYVSGRPMVELHTWARCKPAFIREGAPLAERARRGRPRLDNGLETNSTTPSSELSGDTLAPSDAQSENSSEPKQTNVENERENSNRPRRTCRQPDRLGIDPASN